MNPEYLHHRSNEKSPISADILVYEVAKRIAEEETAIAPAEEELISGERICPLVDKVIEENSSPAFDLNKLEPEEREKMIKQLEELAEAERKNYRHELKEVKLEEMTIKDKLTDLFNRRYGEPTLENEIAQVLRAKKRAKDVKDVKDVKGVSILMIDIDHFKGTNDILGHNIADDALKIVAGILSGSGLRKSDTPCRWGGEEFLVILPDTNEEGARFVAEALRNTVRISLRNQLKNKYKDRAEAIDKIAGTISVGISTYSGEKKIDKEDLLEEADTAMYYSKLTGRNRSTEYEPGMEEEVEQLRIKEIAARVIREEDEEMQAKTG